MSMMYCHKHDEHWDSDFMDECPGCEHDYPEHIKGTTRLLTYKTAFIYNGTGQPVHEDYWALVSWVEGNEWRVIYQCNDVGLQDMIGECIRLAEMWPDHPYAIVAPTPEKSDVR